LDNWQIIQQWIRGTTHACDDDILKNAIICANNHRTWKTALCGLAGKFVRRQRIGPNPVGFQGSNLTLAFVSNTDYFSDERRSV
jgi:hypothetical protein